jgi:autophagy-related protein 2
VRIFDGNFNIFLYNGYDWARTRKAIEEGVKEIRKRLAKIKQLVANGHLEESSLDDTSVLLFNSIHIGLDDDDGALGEPAALIAAIDRELKDDDDETTSWQSLPTFSAGKQPRAPPIRVHGKRLTRSRGPSIEFSLQGLRAEFDNFNHDSPLVSRTFVSVRDIEILDHIKTSTWKKFLTQLRSDSRGNVRETDSNMLRVELRSVRPVPGNPAEEARMKVKNTVQVKYFEVDFQNLRQNCFLSDCMLIRMPSTS